jgi:hypothetical protein
MGLGLVLRGLGWLVVERHGRRSGALVFLLGDELSQFLGVVNHRSVVGMRGRPFPKLLDEAVKVMAGFGRQAVFDVPDFLKDRVGFHAVTLPQTQRACKPLGA